MKIKHFAGYGTVNAVKGGTTRFRDIYGNKVDSRIIVVSGNHERGLELTDTYDVYNWLVKRLFKDVKSYRDINKVSTTVDYIKIDGIDVEHCYYTIDIKTYD